MRNLSVLHVHKLHKLKKGVCRRAAPSFRVDTFPSASCRRKGFVQSCHVLTGLGGYARECEISIHEFAKLETLIHYNFWLHSTFHQERLTCSKFIRCPWRPHLACAMSLDKSGFKTCACQRQGISKKIHH